MRDLIPMLQVLKSMKADDRIILLNHMNDRAKDALYKTITTLLTSKSLSAKKRKLLQKKLEPVAKKSPKGVVAKRKALVQLGGSPLSYVLKTALPLYLNLFAQ